MNEPLYLDYFGVCAPTAMIENLWVVEEILIKGIGAVLRISNRHRFDLHSGLPSVRVYRLLPYLKRRDAINDLVTDAVRREEFVIRFKEEQPSQVLGVYFFQNKRGSRIRD